MHGLFLVEGQKVIQELLDAKFDLIDLFVTDTSFEEISIRTLVSIDQLNKMSALTTANNSLAVFRIPNPKPINLNGLIVVLDKIRDPGNLGTIIRLCDWFGISDLVCSEDTVDLYNPKVLQATMGSIARVNVTYTNLRNFLEINDLPAFGAFMEGENIYKIQFPQKGIIVLGNEANGVTPEIEEWLTQKISIPRFGNPTESLNVATATAVILSEFKRQNHF